MKNDIDCYFDELTDEDVTNWGRIIRKLRMKYGYTNDFSGGYLGTDNTDFDEDDDDYGRKVFTCKYCGDRIVDDILEERMLSNYRVPLCEVCVDPSNCPYNTCFERTCNGGVRCEQHSH